jgi:phosphate transport system substrate-binding protein
MMQRKISSKLQTVLLLGLVSTPIFTTLLLIPKSVQAQTATESPAFPLPASLPADAKVQIDGSSSMSAINKALQDRFAQKFPTAKVNLEGKGTDEALAALEKGEIDLAAIGRPLMPEESAKGLTQVPISREKIAIVVGADNPFTGNITFEQFAKIFRSEIKDWSELGGAPGPIRFIDRPETSDTRHAFQRYPVFQKAPFKTGTTAQAITDDTTDAMIKELGKDGIGYAIASQVLNRDGIRILSMHKTLPSDPRYPFSQPRGYVYKGKPNAAVSSFLGFATTPEGQDAIKTAEATGVVSPGSVAAGNPTDATGGAAAPAMSGEGGIPWWPLLLGIPIVGGLLLWALKGRDKPVASIAPVAKKEVTGATGVVKPQGGAVPFAGDTTGTVKPPQGGAVPFAGAAAGAVAGAAALGVGAAAVGAARSVRKSRMILTPRDSGKAYAYWEATDADKAEARQQGGQKLALRVYDVSSLSTQAFQQYDLDEQAIDRHVPIPVPDHDYRAELGYLTENGRWIKVTQSDSIRVSSVSPASGVVSRAGDTMLRTGKEAAERASTGLGSVSTGVGDAVTGAGSKAADLGSTGLGAAAGLGAAGLGAAGLGAAAGLGSTVKGLGQKMGVSATPNEATQIDVATTSGEATRIDVATTSGEATRIDTIDPPEGRSVANLKVHSQHNCYVLDHRTMEQIQNKAVSQPLEPGSYLIKIQSGSFGYHSGPGSVGEPLVLLWIYGGKVINQKTKVEVGSTWSSLNGYDDLLTLHVREAATLSAFFFDTEVDDNQGEVTLSIVKA